MKRIPESGAEGGADINLSPLIDCIFLLLIFFVVYAVFEQPAGLNVSRPRAVTADTVKRAALIIGVDREGRIEAQGRRLARSQVRGWVADRLREGDRPVVLMADRHVPAGMLVELLDACRLAGAEQVMIGADASSPVMDF